MHDKAMIKTKMMQNAQEITRLQSYINETFALRDNSEQYYEEWKRACAEFHAQYNDLAFPGGWEDALERVKRGDSDTI
jgi:hypothetical protein